MSAKKIYMKRVLTAALALSIIAGTGITSLSASAATPAPTSSISEKVSQFRTWLSGVISTRFDTEEAKEMMAKLSEKVLSMIPEETKAKFEETIQLLSDEDFPEEMIRQLISDFADTVFKNVVVPTVTYAWKQYQQLPDEQREKIEASLMQIRQFISEVKARAEKYQIVGNNVLLTEGDFLYVMTLNLSTGIEAVAYAYLGEATSVAIPATADGFNVTSAFMGSMAALKSVTVPETFTNLNGYSFCNIDTLKYIFVNSQNPNFKSVKGVVYDKSGATLVAVPPANKYTIPENVTAIGSLAFASSSMSSLTIPSTVTSIGMGAFAGMSNLEEITIPDGVTKIEEYTFTDCLSLQKVVIPSSVTEIADNAFENVNEDIVFVCQDASDYAVKYAESKGIKVSVPLNAEFNAPTLVILGAKAKFTIDAEYGEGDYSYSYLIRRMGTTTWKKLKVNSPSNTYTYTPSETGNFEVCMKVKDSSGKVVKFYSAMSVIQTPNNKSTISSDTVTIGEPLTVYCGAVDPKTQFAVCYREPSSSTWKVAQKYSENDVVELTFSEVGSCEVCVKAKSSLGFISKTYFLVSSVESAE